MVSLHGKLIVVEGLEGAGKSSAITTIIELLAQKQIKTITTREPGGTAIGEILRALIKAPEYREVLDDRSELLLLYAARIQLMKQVIEPSLRQGIWVIADRFELSTMAYQGGGRGLSQEMIHQLSSFSLQGFQPDLTLYLDISPEEGMQRVKSRGAFDRIEQQSIEFFHCVHASYLQYVNAHSNIVSINARRPLPEVQDAIRKAVTEFIIEMRDD